MQLVDHTSKLGNALQNGQTRNTTSKVDPEILEAVSFQVAQVSQDPFML